MLDNYAKYLDPIYHGTSKGVNATVAAAYEVGEIISNYTGARQAAALAHDGIVAAYDYTGQFANDHAYTLSALAGTALVTYQVLYAANPYAAAIPLLCTASINLITAYQVREGIISQETKDKIDNASYHMTLTGPFALSEKLSTVTVSSMDFINKAVQKGIPAIANYYMIGGINQATERLTTEDTSTIANEFTMGKIANKQVFAQPIKFALIADIKSPSALALTALGGALSYTAKVPLIEEQRIQRDLVDKSLKQTKKLLSKQLTSSDLEERKDYEKALASAIKEGNKFANLADLKSGLPQLVEANLLKHNLSPEIASVLKENAEKIICDLTSQASESDYSTQQKLLYLNEALQGAVFTSAFGLARAVTNFPIAPIIRVLETHVNYNVVPKVEEHQHRYFELPYAAYDELKPLVAQQNGAEVASLLSNAMNVASNIRLAAQFDPLLTLSVAFLPLAVVAKPQNVVAFELLSLYTALSTKIMLEDGKISEVNAAILNGLAISGVFAANCVNLAAVPAPYYGPVKAIGAKAYAALPATFSDKLNTIAAKAYTGGEAALAAIKTAAPVLYAVGEKALAALNSGVQITDTLMPSMAFISVQSMAVDRITNSPNITALFTPSSEISWDNTIFLSSNFIGFNFKFSLASKSYLSKFMYGGTSYLIVQAIKEEAEYALSNKTSGIYPAIAGYGWDNKTVIDHNLDKLMYNFVKQANSSHPSYEADLELFSQAKAAAELAFADHNPDAAITALSQVYHETMADRDLSDKQQKLLHDLVSDSEAFIKAFNAEKAMAAGCTQAVIKFVQGGLNSVLYEFSDRNSPEGAAEMANWLPISLIEGQESFIANDHFYTKHSTQAVVEENICYYLVPVLNLFSSSSGNYSVQDEL
jgi:hypothetical protein